MLTSINLESKSLRLWKLHRREISSQLPNHCARLTRLIGRRDCATRYNRRGRKYSKISVRFTPEEFNTLRHCSQTLRLSVSRIIDLLLRFWEIFSRKPSYPSLRSSYHYRIRIVRGLKIQTIEVWRNNNPSTRHHLDAVSRTPVPS